MNQFLEDVLRGLRSTPKFLQSKYFYDATGDKIFKEIMDCPEYYLTNCEMEIFAGQTEELAASIVDHAREFDIIEMGAGDATKSIHLLKKLMQWPHTFTYYPVDISVSVINNLERFLPITLPDIQLQGLNGEYFQMLEKAKTLSDRIKVVLFLGSNIGNIRLEETESFCRSLRSHLTKGDLLLIGFDLKKHPLVILNAYNDKGGLTKKFNLNLLHRINRELSGTFIPEQFEHYPNYDPLSGACKSYLISLKDQSVSIGGQAIHFDMYEPVFMEISQKFTVEQTDIIARNTGFQPIRHFQDSKEWFLDTIWQCV